MRFSGALILAAGLALCGFFTGHGFFKGRAADRFVTVKGVAERDVVADVALWPITFVATGDELRATQADIRRSHGLTLEFLRSHGIDAGEVEVQSLDVTDVFANAYRTGPVQNRFIIEQTLMVRTGDPAVVDSASQAVGELVDTGVVLSSRGMPGGGPTYLFTDLSSLKPEMIAEATAKARRAAEQFAQDSGSRIGKIRRANQGVFVILARDRARGVSEESQINKTVRVVSTVEYYLKD
jgi:hypothetical protein